MDSLLLKPRVPAFMVPQLSEAMDVLQEKERDLMITRAIFPSLSFVLKYFNPSLQAIVVGRVEIKELHEEHADPDMDSCNAGKESALDCFEDESTGSKPLPANGSRDHICTFKDVLMRGLKERDVS
ncbi:hypothetical protein SASPL_111181 [Salvia splendens]|uniref:Uncharacterized protein n=1 Tax=Salvia splendens TaxID=180675 RepID=A0A8X9A342_SALSN|nr:hypothetical protein SASPL_111181 [Salvia splendens]